MQKKEVWEQLTQKMEGLNGEIILVVGYFNATRNNLDKRGGLGKIIIAQQDFQSFIDQNNLKDLQERNGIFTWTNRRKDFTNIGERLDRIFMTGNWDALLQFHDVSILPLIGSDHFLVQMSWF